MYSQTDAAVTNLRNEMRKLGLALPTALAEKLASADTINASYNSPEDETQEIANSVADALVAGKDPLADKTIRDFALRHALRAADLGIANRLHERTEAIRFAALRDHADEVIESMRPITEKANAAIQKAHAEIPNPNLNVKQTALTGQRLATWALARQGVEDLQGVVSVWLGLATINRRDTGDKWAILADLDTFEEIPEPALRNDALKKITDGVPVSLVNFGQYRDRIAKVKQLREAETTRREREWKQQFANHH